MDHSAGKLRQRGSGPNPVEGNVCGCGGWSQRLELEHTDVKALTDVSATDARFFFPSMHSCGDVHARAFALLCTVLICTSSSVQGICHCVQT